MNYSVPRNLLEVHSARYFVASRKIERGNLIR